MASHRDNPRWYRQAACIGTHPGLWFPDGDNLPPGIRTPQEAAARAREICDVCPVRVECKSEVFEVEAPVGRNHMHGIYARMTRDERYQERGVKRRPGRRKGWTKEDDRQVYGG